LQQNGPLPLKEENRTALIEDPFDFRENYQPRSFINKHVELVQDDKLDTIFIVPGIIRNIPLETDIIYLRYQEYTQKIFSTRIKIIQASNVSATHNNKKMQAVRKHSFMLGQAFLIKTDFLQLPLVSTFIEWLYYYDDGCDFLSEWAKVYLDFPQPGFEEWKSQYLGGIVEYMVLCLKNGIGNRDKKPKTFIASFTLDFELWINLGDSIFQICGDLVKCSPNAKTAPSDLELFVDYMQQYFLSIIKSNAKNQSPQSPNEYNNLHYHKAATNGGVYLSMIIGFWNNKHHNITESFQKNHESLLHYFKVIGQVLHVHNALSWYKDIGKEEDALKAIYIAKELNRESGNMALADTPGKHGELLKIHRVTDVGYAADQSLFKHAEDVFQTFINLDNKLMLKAKNLPPKVESYYVIQFARLSAQRWAVVSFATLFASCRYSTRILSTFLAEKIFVKNGKIILKSVLIHIMLEI